MPPPESGILSDELGARGAELVRSSERLQTILEHAPVMIDSFDRQGRCLLWNRECEKMLGWSRREIESSEDPLSLFYPDEAERARVLANISRADGSFREYRVRARDGSTRIQLWADFSLPTGELISVGHDVTEQRRLESQLRQVQKLEAMGRLSGGVAHEFNNLLTVMLGNMELITATLPADATRLRELAAEVQRAALRGGRLIRRLLTFSRTEPLELQLLEAAPIVERTAKTLRRLLPDSIEIEIQIDGSLPTISSDPDAVEQILINLVTNARDAMPQGGVLRIELRAIRVDGDEARRLGGRPGDFVGLAVRDNGFGMAAQTRERALEPFFTTKDSEHGSGLGLAIVYGLVEQHGGFVALHSEPGRGTSVTVYFPIDGRPVPVSDGERAAATLGGSETILIAEDEASIREVARAALEDRGYSVLEAADGQAALALVRSRGSEIDLVVADVVMPRLGGTELVRMARRAAPGIRFLLTTGYGDQDVPGGGGDRSPEAPLLHKPWTVQELCGRVREVLDA